jgi:hypothetical protein
VCRTPFREQNVINEGANDKGKMDTSRGCGMNLKEGKT